MRSSRTYGIIAKSTAISVGNRLCHFLKSIVMEALYIEDNVIEQRLISLYMADMNIKLHLAGNGSDGLATAHKVLPSFIMMDMVIPDMDGETLLKLLKEDQQLQHIPIIIMTADLLIDRKMDVFELGATACLIKPVGKSVIAGMLKQLF